MFSVSSGLWFSVFMTKTGYLTSQLCNFNFIYTYKWCSWAHHLFPNVKSYQNTICWHPTGSATCSFHIPEQGCGHFVGLYQCTSEWIRRSQSSHTNNSSSDFSYPVLMSAVLLHVYHEDLVVHKAGLPTKRMTTCGPRPKGHKTFQFNHKFGNYINCRLVFAPLIVKSRWVLYYEPFSMAHTPTGMLCQSPLCLYCTCSAPTPKWSSCRNCVLGIEKKPDRQF